MQFLKKEHRYNGFRHKWYKSPESYNLTTLTNFMPLASLFSPWKHQETSGFQGVEKQTTDMEWVNPLIQSLEKKYDTLNKCSKVTINIIDVSTFYPLRVAKKNKNEFKNLQDLKETGEGLVTFKFKLDYVEGQFIVEVSWSLITIGLLW